MTLNHTNISRDKRFVAWGRLSWLQHVCTHVHRTETDELRREGGKNRNGSHYSNLHSYSAKVNPFTGDDTHTLTLVCQQIHKPSFYSHDTEAHFQRRMGCCHTNILTHTQKIAEHSCKDGAISVSVGSLFVSNGEGSQVTREKTKWTAVFSSLFSLTASATHQIITAALLPPALLFKLVTFLFFTFVIFIKYNQKDKKLKWIHPPALPRPPLRL